MKFFLLILSLCLTLISFEQIYPDSGFTNKAEAKNLKVHGKKEGKWKEYLYEKGDITTDSNPPFYSLSIYHKGKPYGMVRIYREETGKLFMEAPYDAKGKENGIEKQYYDSGKLMYERPYVNDKRNGTLKRYYESGKLEMENQFVNDEMNGVLKRYGENGKLLSETVYENEVEKGTTYYDENGNEIK